MENLCELLTLYDESERKRNDTNFCSNLLKELRKSKVQTDQYQAKLELNQLFIR